MQNFMNFGPQTAKNNTCIFTDHLYILVFASLLSLTFRGHQIQVNQILPDGGVNQALKML